MVSCCTLIIIDQRDSLLLIFSITPVKIDQNQNQNHSIDKVWNLGMKGGKYTTFLAKIHSRRKFRI